MGGDGPDLLRAATVTLIHPAIGAYFPCAEIPRISDGVVEIPTAHVAHRYWNVLERDSPFTAAAELYGLRRVVGRPYHGADVESVARVIPGYARADAIVVTDDGE